MSYRACLLYTLVSRAIPSAVTILFLLLSGIATAAPAFRYQGFNLMAFGKGEYANEPLLVQALDYIVSTHSNLVVIDWMVAVDDDGHVLPAADAQSFEPFRKDIVRAVELARERKLMVFLKPHPGFAGRPWDNRATFNTDLTRFSLDRFFREWTDYLVSLGPIATAHGVEAIVIGTENAGFDSANRSHWATMIASVRDVFPGKISYDAAFQVQNLSLVESVCFWDLVDIIGMSLYVALSDDDQASLRDLNAAWRDNPYAQHADIVAFLHGLSLRYNKPVMALEGGYQSIAGGLRDVGPVDEGRPVDNAVQARGIESYLDTLGKHQADWFAGVSLWTVYPPFFDAANRQTWGYLQGYMTNEKPATDVIRRYFSGQTTYLDPVFTGSVVADRLFGSYGADAISGGAGDDFLWGGVGNDTIIAGPGLLSPLASAAFVVRALGDVTSTGGPRLRLLVNGQAFGEWIEVIAEKDQSAQSIAFSIPLSPSVRIDTLGIETQPDPEFANGVNRAVYVKSITLNGYALSEKDGVYTVGSQQTMGAGSWSRIYSGTTLTQNVALQQALLRGAQSDLDVMVGGAGDDFIDGGAGIDAAVYAGRFADFAITSAAGGFTVTDLTGNEGTDTLVNVELLQFVDRIVDLRMDSDTVPVVEFYNAALDHYFITWIPVERSNLYRRLTPSPWEATGHSFVAYRGAHPGTSPVCRFYIPPALGDSHFFGRGTEECTGTGERHPSFVLEDGQFMHLALPAAGTCAPGTRPVYRLFSNRPDANHRYTTDRSVRDAMVAKGWAAEGDGPDRVVMCAVDAG